MGSMYNMLFGENPLSSAFLKILGLTKEKIPRYRDCFWTGQYIAVYTRTGGGNRAYYESLESCRENYPEYFDGGKDEPRGPWNSDLRNHPEYVKDEDDDNDTTYATFYFNLPAKFEGILPAVPSLTPAEKFKILMEKMDKVGSKDDPDVKRVMETMSPIMEKLMKAIDEK